MMLHFEFKLRTTRFDVAFRLYLPFRVCLLSYYGLIDWRQLLDLVSDAVTRFPMC